jgi:hypothetical protein
MIVFACLPIVATTTTAIRKFVTAQKPCATGTDTTFQAEVPVSLPFQAPQANTRLSGPIAVSTTWQIEGTMHGNWNG